MREELLELFKNNATSVQNSKTTFDNRCRDEFIEKLEKYIENKEENAFNLATEVDFSTMDYKYPTFKDYKNEK